MTKFKLINKATKEEHICTKKEVLGKIYYETDKEVIATDGHSIDGIGKVIDEVFAMAEEEHTLNDEDVDKVSFILGYVTAHGNSEKLHRFSEQDMIDFAKFFTQYTFIDNTSVGDLYALDETGNHPAYTMLELLFIWKENHKLTVLYYE